MEHSFYRGNHHGCAHHRTAFHSGRESIDSGPQYFCAERYHASGIYHLRSVRLFHNRRSVLVHTKSNAGKPSAPGIPICAFCCVTWVAYLWEPLPHVAPLDRITYPIADSLAFLVMGLLLGLLLGNRDNAQKRQRPGTCPSRCLSFYHSVLSVTC